MPGEMLNTKFRNKKIFINRVVKGLGAALLFIFVFCILNLELAEPAIIRIDQPKLRLVISPGETQSGTINVKNPAANSLAIKVYLEDWLYTSSIDGSKKFYPPGTLPLSCAEWIRFVPAEFTISPYGKQVVNYTVNCPADAKGGHYAVMFFETSLGEVKDEEGVNVTVLGRLGSLFCVEPEGTINRTAELSNLSIVRNKGIDIELQFENTGNIDIISEGTFYLMDRKGIIAARGEFDKIYTFPGDKAVISSSISEQTAPEIPEGEYDLVITIDLGGMPEVLEARLKVGPSGKISYSYP